MANTPTVGGLSKILANPSPDSSSDVPDVVVQIIDLNATGNGCMFAANDGDMKLTAFLPSYLPPDAKSGNIQNLGLIRVIDYSVEVIPNRTEK